MAPFIVGHMVRSVRTGAAGFCGDRYPWSLTMWLKTASETGVIE